MTNDGPSSLPALGKGSLVFVVVLLLCSGVGAVTHSTTISRDPSQLLSRPASTPGTSRVIPRTAGSLQSTVFGTSIDVGGGPVGVAYDNANGLLYVTDSATNLTVAVNGSNHAVVGSFPVGTRPGAVAYDDATGYVFVANNGGDNVSVIDTVSGTAIGSIPVGADPTALAVDTTNGNVYVTVNDGSNGNLIVVNATTLATVATIPVGQAPEGVALDDSNGFLYVGNAGAFGGLGGSAATYSVSIVETATNEVVDSIPLGEGGTNSGAGPSAVTYVPSNGDIYVPNFGFNDLTVISGANNEVVGSISVGSSPDAAIYDASTAQIDVMDRNSNNVTVVDTASNSVVGSVPVGNSPFGGAFDGANGLVYAANAGSGNLTVIGSLSNIEVAPTGATVGPNAAVVLNVSLSCTADPCPAGATYRWTVSNTLATLNVSSGPTVLVLAGSSTGKVTLSVRASLDGRTVSASANVTISESTGFLDLPGDDGYYILFAAIPGAAALAIILHEVRKGERLPKRKPPPP
jgi:YVTN family beta-propeller protein